MGAFSREREPFIIKGEETPAVSHEHEELLDNTLSPSERDQILKDLFEGKEGSVDSSFLYLGKGAELYELISKDKTYPFIEIEKNILENLRDNSEFTKILKKIKHITDVGSGDGQKSIALLGKRETKNDGEAVEEAKNEEKSEDEVNRNGELILSDVSNEMLTKAIKNVKANSKNIKLGNAQVQQSQKHLSSYCNDNMFLFLGGTICNMTDEEIQKELKNMDNHGLFTGNYILLSYFTAPETKDEISNLIKIYNSETNKAFHKNGMDMLGLKKDNFEFDTIYQLDNGTKLKLENGVLNSYEGDLNNFSEGPFPGRIKGIIRAKIDSVVKLSDGTEISVKQGQEFTIHYSRRFSKEYIDKLFKKSDCEKTDIEINEGGDTMVLLRRKPRIGEIIRRNKKSIAAALTMSVLMLLGVGVHDVIKTNQENRQKEKAHLDWGAKRLLSNEVPYQSIYYTQETNELISALKLDELSNDKKNYIIKLFNIYVEGEKYNNNGISTDELIQGFWVKYGSLLLDDENGFGLKHYPYDFMSRELIGTTNSISDNLSYTPKYHGDDFVYSKFYSGYDYGVYTALINLNNGKRVIEYNDGGKDYLILKVKIGTGYVYLAAEKKEGESHPKYSTGCINEIKDKSGLDQEILSNTENLGGCYVFNVPVDINGIYSQSASELLLKNINNDQIIKTTSLNDSRRKVDEIFINGKKYYVMTVETRSGKHVGFAAESIDGPYTIDTFKNISNHFDCNGYLGQLPFG